MVVRAFEIIIGMQHLLVKVVLRVARGIAHASSGGLENILSVLQKTTLMAGED